MWFFTIHGYTYDQYIQEVSNDTWDGLRDRGWLDSMSHYVQNDTSVVSGNVTQNTTHAMSFWERLQFLLSGKATGVSTSINTGTDPNVLSFHVHNQILAFFVDVTSLLLVLMIPIAMFIFFLWYYEMKKAVDHYYHLFHNSFGYKETYATSNTEYLDTISLPEKGKGSTNHHHIETYQTTDTDGNSVQVLVPDQIVAPSMAEYSNHPRWAIVEGYMAAPHEAMWRMGIIEADTMLDNVLTERGYMGADLGEKLRGLNFHSIQLAWDAHKVRNRIAHEGSNYRLTEREARRVFAMYEAVFKEMKVI
jgi:hypothetical protein